MSSFGDNFRRERQAKGITLQEISEQTKIGVRQLKAIEEGHLDQLPGGIFNKSFLRQYARFLELDEEQVISEYMQAIGEAPVAESTPAILSREEGSPVWFAGYPRLFLSAVILGIAIVGVFYVIRSITERRVSIRSPEVSIPVAAGDTSRELSGLSAPSSVANSPETMASGAAISPPIQIPGPQQQSPSLESTPSAPAAPPPVAEGSLASKPGQSLAQPAAIAVKPPAESSAGGAEGLVLQIQTRRDVWLSITSDGQKQWQGTLLADRTRQIQARETVLLTVGDADAVTLTLNGKILPVTGRAGEVKTLTISAKELAEPAP